MTKLNSKQVMELINNDLEYAMNATENSYRNKCFVVLEGDRIQRFSKTKRGAESYIKKQTFSYYDEYFMEMRESGTNLYVVEICSLDIIDYFNTTSIWFTTLKNRWSRHQSNEYMLNKAEELGASENVVELVKYILAESDYHSFPSYEMVFDTPEPEEVEEVQEQPETIETAPESVETIEEIQSITESNRTVQMKLNEEKNGIELYFDDKPNEEIRNILKSNGFRWSKYNKCWYSKKSEKTLAIAEQLSNSEITSEDAEPIEIELLEFDDIAQYTISEQLESRLNSNSFFPHKKGYYTEDLQATFENRKNEALKVIELTDDIYYQNKVIYLFNRYMKNYHNEYVSYLNMKANNPSWAVTGRGNMNVSRYNKKQDQVFNKMGKTVEISNKFENDLDKIKWKMKKNEQYKTQKAINEAINNNTISLSFQTEKRTVTVGGYTETKRAYISPNYFILKTWGCFRIFDNNGKEVHSMKTNENLTDAKNYVLYLESLKMNEKQAI